MPRQILSPPTVHKPVTVYSHGVAIENIIYSAGQAPHILSGAVISSGDPQGQVEAAFQNMAEVLKAGGADFSDLVKVNLLAKRSDLIPLFFQALQARAGQTRPAFCAALVDGLAGPDYLLEFEAIAVKE